MWLDVGKLGLVRNRRPLAEESHELTEDGKIPPGVGVLQNVEGKVPGASGEQGRQADSQGIPWPQFRDHVRVWIEPVACRHDQMPQPDGIAVARGVRSAGTFCAKPAYPRDEGCRAVQELAELHCGWTPRAAATAGHGAAAGFVANPIAAATAAFERKTVRAAKAPSRLLRKGVGGVASAAESDARRRDEGDAGAHRGGAATPQTAPRRRNRLRWLAFCSRCRSSEEHLGRREVSRVASCKRPDTTSASIFQLPARGRACSAGAISVVGDSSARRLIRIGSLADGERRPCPGAGAWIASNFEGFSGRFLRGYALALPWRPIARTAGHW